MLQLSYRREQWGSDCWNDCHGADILHCNLFMYLFICLWCQLWKKKKTISAGFTGIGVILLSLSLKARFIAVSSGKG